jgi:chemotaxis protein CheD
MASAPSSSGPSLAPIIIDLADMKATNNPAVRLMSNVLGACVGMAIYDPVARVGGLLQFLLPESTLDRQKALKNPFLFADTGIPMLFRRCYKLGGVKERMICRMAGGCSVLDRRKVFDMGLRNQLAARKVLSNNHVSLAGEMVGGHAGMTISLFMESGRMIVKTSCGEELEI